MINGVDVAPLIEAELDPRDPNRPKMRPPTRPGSARRGTSSSGCGPATVERARKLPPDQLHVSVDGEWSFIETLRHLVFATESWVHRAILGDPAPWDPLSLPWDECRTRRGCPA